MNNTTNNNTKTPHEMHTRARKAKQSSSSIGENTISRRQIRQLLASEWVDMMMV